jgi:hypothetical protein
MTMRHSVWIPLIAAATVFLQTQGGFAGTKQISEGFESSAPDWTADGRGAGFDLGKGTGHAGQGNAWVGRAAGSNMLNTWLDIPKYSLCSAQAWIKLSPTFTEGSMLVAGGDGTTIGATIKELKLPQIAQAVPNPTDYNLYHVDFNTGTNPKIFFDIGLNGKDENSWELVDDFAVSCKTPM